ncbi:hypothetical protein POF45_00405 [Pseudomonas sp. 681]|uniref:Uncharacterized protein n=1 Tax=Pseudomonas fungipugnans TaxID=3024217 RepID=A0ABT6QGA7_9PSED|nr:hypothetical protein [Pseudomonas sp. 681]MDI2589891.1 hypothetical protein [Pseudomonas sp. 681]
MPELAKKAPNLSQGAATPFTLFEQNGISITLALPSILKLNLGRDEEYITAPILKNDSPYTVISAAFRISLSSVSNAAKDVIATVQWLDSDSLETKDVMSFTCGSVPAGKVLQCEPATKGYKKVQWKSTMNSGTGQELLNNSLTLDSIVLGPIASEAVPATGPNINVGPNN